MFHSLQRRFQSLHWRHLLFTSLFATIAISWPKASRATQDGDQALKRSVDELLANDGLQPRDLRISVRQGVVTLTGQVADLRRRGLALEWVTSLKGVRSVVDRIRIRPLKIKSDRTIAEDVVEALTLDEGTQSLRLGVESRSGIVTLTGSAPSWAERQLAEWVAAGVGGVVAVRNRVQIVGTSIEGTPRMDTAALVRGFLLQDPLIESRWISVASDHGKLRLKGRVPSLGQRDRVVRHAWRPGVSEVDISDLDVDPTLESATDDVGNTSDDSKIADSINAALRFHPRGARFRPRIEVRDGTAVLSGFVQSPAARHAARLAAFATPGVKGVVDRINVVPLKPMEDDELTWNATRLIELDPTLDEASLRIRVRSGVATLEGRVRTPFERSLAETCVLRVSGLRDVDNRIDVVRGARSVSKGSSQDRILALNIQKKLKSTTVFEDDDRLQVTVQNGVASLSGKVDTWYEHSQATRFAFAGGAERVINALRVGSAPIGRDGKPYVFSRLPSSVYGFEWSAPAVGPSITVDPVPRGRRPDPALPNASEGA